MASGGHCAIPMTLNTHYRPWLAAKMNKGGRYGKPVMELFSERNQECKNLVSQVRSVSLRSQPSVVRQWICK